MEFTYTLSPVSCKFFFLVCYLAKELDVNKNAHVYFVDFPLHRRKSVLANNGNTRHKDGPCSEADSLFRSRVRGEF